METDIPFLKNWLRDDSNTIMTIHEKLIHYLCNNLSKNTMKQYLKLTPPPFLKNRMEKRHEIAMDKYGNCMVGLENFSKSQHATTQNVEKVLEDLKKYK